MKFSVIIPVLNEASGIKNFLSALQIFREHGEIIIVDAGSQDNTVAFATPLADIIIKSDRGRSKQMNAGVQAASGNILLFLHADTYLPDDAQAIIEKKMSPNNQWGRFDIKLSGTHCGFGIIAQFMNWRSRLTGISTGDQGLFVEKQLFNQAGKFPEIPLMEDIAICKQLKLFSPPICLKAKAITSSRRWKQFGITRTILLMWWLRLLYFFGYNPETLAQLYTRGIFWKTSSD
jgi:rSAM/selenodomain-associated transferase 2